MSRFWRHFVTNGTARLVEDHLGLFGQQTAQPESGFKVRLVHPGSPAAWAGLQPGDVLLSVDDTPIRTLHHLERLLLDLPVGLPLAICFARGNKHWTRWLILTEHPRPAFRSPKD